MSCISIAQSQTNSLKFIWEDETLIDSVRFKALDTHLNAISSSDPDSALVVLDYYNDFADSRKSKLHMFLAKKRMGNIHRLKGNYDISMGHYENAALLANQLKDTLKQADILGNMGNVHFYKNDYLKAIQHFSKALKVYQQKNDIKHEGRMYTKLGTVYLVINNFELANEYYAKSLKVLNDRGIEDKSKAVLYINIGWTQYKQGLYKKANDNFLKGLKIMQEKNEKFFIAECYANLALSYYELKDLIQATKYGQKNLALYEELNIESSIIDAKITLAKIAFETNIKEATNQGEAILGNLPKNLSKEIKSRLYELLYKCYKAQNKLDLSLKMHEEYTLYNDSIQIEKNNFALAREAVKNEFENKLYEKQLESEKEKAELKDSQLKKTYGIICASILTIGLILFYFIAKIKKDNKERDTLLEEVTRLKNINPTIVTEKAKFKLERDKIEDFIRRNINETDWKVLNILLDDPVIPNKDIAKKIFMSTDGIGSSLRRMYDYFDVKESKYKKISLLMMAIKISNN